MIVNRFHLSHQIMCLFLKVMTWGIMGLVCAQTAYSVDVDTKSYDPASGVKVKVAGELLVMGWDTPEGSTELTLNVSSIK